MATGDTTSVSLFRNKWLIFGKIHNNPGEFQDFTRRQFEQFWTCFNVSLFPGNFSVWKITRAENDKCRDSANQRTVSRSRDHSQPIRGSGRCRLCTTEITFQLDTENNSVFSRICLVVNCPLRSFYSVFNLTWNKLGRKYPFLRDSFHTNLSQIIKIIFHKNLLMDVPN